MAKGKKARFKESRSLGLNVCGHPKAMKRASKGSSRADKKLTEYGRQLLEKQRLRAYYGLREGQFKNYYKKAHRSEGLVGHALVGQLETRLDNMVYRMGFASSIRQARQMVVHRHILVNSKRVDIPSYELRPGDSVELRPKSRTIDEFKTNYEENFLTSLDYIEKEEDFKGVLKRLPRRDEVPILIEDQLVVEFYSRYA